MEGEYVLIPENILTAENLRYFPENIQKKLKEWLKKLCEEKMAAAASIQQYDERQLKMQSLNADLEIKLQKSAENINELRTQLDTVSNERINLLETVNKYERGLGTLRSERNEITKERDTLIRKVERQKMELERLQVEFSSAEKQLKNAIGTKCEAIARLGDIDSKKALLKLKEQRFEQERTMLNNQIQALSDDLNRTIKELQSVRSHSRMEMMHIETQLKNKIKEMRIFERKCIQLQKENSDLKEKIRRDDEDSSNKIDEYQKYIDRLRNELSAKTKLAELYKDEAVDKEQKTLEIISAINDHKSMLKEAENLHGEMETKLKAITLKHEQDLQEKDKKIETLSDELNSCKELIKAAQTESVDNAISQLATSATVANRLMRADLSMTELYSMYVKATEDLEAQKRDNGRLTLQIKKILWELEEKAPQIQKKCFEYEKLVEANCILAHQRDELLSERAELEKRLEKQERWIKQHREQVNDKNRQIYCLLREQDKLRSGDISDDMNNGQTNIDTILSDPSEIISEHLVTFKSIVEMQEQNDKLILCVRDLSNKVEESHQPKPVENHYKEKFESSVKRLQDMQESLNQQNITISTLLSKCEHYKKLYFKTQKSINKPMHYDCMDVSLAESDSEGESDDEERSRKSPDGKCESSKDIKRMRELECDVTEAKGKYNAIKEQYEFYKKEKQNNEKFMNEQFDSLRSEVRELTSSNCKLSASSDYTKEQLKLQQNNIAIYKIQISALQDRNRSNEKTIVQHEQSVQYLKKELIKTQRENSLAESEAKRLSRENLVLNDTVARLQIEKEVLYQQSQNQNLLLSNLEFIKIHLERTESEGRLRLETQLDDTIRELGAQRLQLQEKEQRFRELTQFLQQETENAKRLAKEEKEQAKRLRNELIAVREELGQKPRQFETLTTSKDGNPIDKMTKKVLELELKLNENKVVTDSIVKERDDARTQSIEYSKMAQNAEKEIRNLNETHVTEKAKLEAEISKLQKANLDMKSKISELEAEVQIVNIPENNVTDTNVAIYLEKTQTELKQSLHKLADSERNLRKLRTDNTTLAETLSALEVKYANEMHLHLVDIQELTKIKNESTRIHDELLTLQSERDSNKEAYQKLKDNENERVRLIENEKKDLEARIVDLNTLNTNLHDQIESLITKLKEAPDNAHNYQHLHREEEENVRKLNERIKMLEDELAPSNEQGSELTAKLNGTTSENFSFRTEAMKWRQRANVLVEKNNKISQEFKRLQLERENLAKMLTNEKDISKKLRNDLNSLRTEKARLEQEMHALQRQLQQANEQKKKVSDDFSTQKQINAHIIAEVMDVKNKLLQKEEICQKLAEELEHKETKLLDIKNKEIQTRRIAERYKESFMELKVQTSGSEMTADNAASTSQDRMDISGNVGDGAGGSNVVFALDQAAQNSKLRLEIDSLNKTITNLREENVCMRKNSDWYKAQKSASVTPTGGEETSLASIRRSSVQNSCTAAVMPTSQETSSTGSSPSTSSTSSSMGTSVSSLAGSSNSELVLPKQVHTSGNSSIGSPSSSPTSSHTDYIPSPGSSASVSVTAIPPMGTVSRSDSESSHEAESIKRDPQQNEFQLIISGGHQQVVALDSSIVEGSLQDASFLPNLQLQKDPNAIKQTSTFDTTSSTSRIATTNHSRHKSPSSTVTSQAGTPAGHKRPCKHYGDSSTSAEEGDSDKIPSNIPKRLRTPMHSAGVNAVASIMVGVADADVEYRVSTSSQRGQEDEIHSLGDVDDDEEDDSMAEADDEPAEGEHDGYEDYEADQDMDVNESNIQCSVHADEVDGDDDEEDDGNEIEVKEVQPSISGRGDHQSSGATQSEIQDVQKSEENTDGVSSEGEKQALEEIGEEGREAKPSTSPSVNTRSQGTMSANRGGDSKRRPTRSYRRGGNLSPIVWGNVNPSRQQMQQQHQPVSPVRGACLPQSPQRRSTRVRGRGNLSGSFNSRPCYNVSTRNRNIFKTMPSYTSRTAISKAIKSRNISRNRRVSRPLTGRPRGRPPKVSKTVKNESK